MERGVGSVTAERLIVLGEMFGWRADELLLQARHRPMDQGAELADLLESLPSPERLYLMESFRNSYRYALEREQVKRERV